MPDARCQLPVNGHGYDNGSGHGNGNNGTLRQVLGQAG
jgi:hypothetical protein